MKELIKLPEAEFEVMKVIWDSEQPVTSNVIMEKLGNSKNWKAPTAISLMGRLIEKGFLTSEKKGKERHYYSLIDKETYMEFETSNFVKQYHNNSFVGLVNTLYNGKHLKDDDIEELLNWAKDRR